MALTVVNWIAAHFKNTKLNCKLFQTSLSCRRLIRVEICELFLKSFWLYTLSTYFLRITAWDLHFTRYSGNTVRSLRCGGQDQNHWREISPTSRVPEIIRIGLFSFALFKKYNIDVSGTQCMLKQVSVNVDTSPRTGHSCDVRIN